MNHCFQAQLPPELWFSILSTLSASDLLSIRLTSRLFSELSLPLVFTILRFRPSLDDAPRAYEELYTAMEFWTSDRIASYVVECEFAPNSGFLSREESEWDMEMQDLTRFVEAFFETLAQFRNIATLKATAIPFSDKALSDLCQLGSLKTLQVSECIITSTSNPGRLEVERFSFSSHALQEMVYDMGAIGWANILVVPRLKHFEISVFIAHSLLLRGIAPYTTHQKRKAFYTALRTFLEPAKALESLTIAPYTTKEWTLEATFPAELLCKIPSLREYEGPLALFNALVIGDRLRKLYVRPFSVGQYLSALDIPRIFHTKSELAVTLESLGLWVNDDNLEELLKMIKRDFTNLRELRLSMSRRVDESQLIHAASRHLPQSLQVFKVDIDDRFNNNRFSSFQFNVRWTLFNNYPSLERVKFTVGQSTVVSDWEREMESGVDGPAVVVKSLPGERKWLMFDG